MLRKVLLICAITFYTNLNAQVVDTLKYYYPYYPDSLNSCLFSGICFDSTMCEPIAVFFTPDSSKPNQTYNYYSVNEIRFSFPDTGLTIFSIHTGAEFPSDNNIIYRDSINTGNESINRNFLDNGQYVFSTVNVSKNSQLRSIDINKPFWVLSEAKVFKIFNTYNPDYVSSNHSYFVFNNSEWSISECDWIIEAVIEYQEDVIDGLEHQTFNFQGKTFLKQNNPNPFNAYAAKINYEVGEAGLIDISVFTIDGRKIKTIVNEYQNKGTYSAVFNSSTLTSGSYIYTIRVNNILTDSKKMTLIK